MATAVQLELIVDEKGAVQGVRAFDAALKGTASSTSSLDATLQRMNTQMSQVGQRGAQAGQQARNGLKAVHQESLSTREGIHLITEEFGIELPKAFKKFVAESSAAEVAVKALSGAIAGIAGIQIGVMLFEQVAEGAKKLWENMLNVDAAIEEYNKEVKKAQQADFGNTHSIETTRLRIEEAKQMVEAYRAEAEKLDKTANHSWVHALDPAAPYMMWQANQANKQAMDWQRTADKMQQQSLPEQRHQQNLGQIELQHAGDARLQGEKKITAELEKQRSINAENARYAREQDSALGNPVTQTSLWTKNPLSRSMPISGAPGPEQEAADARAAAQADAERFNLERQQAQEMMQLRHAAAEAGLAGSRLYHQQEADAIEDLKYKEIDRTAAATLIRERFHKEEMKRLDEEREAVADRRAAADSMNLTGVPKIQADMVEQIRKINESKTYVNEGDRQADIATARETALKKQEALDRDYTKKVDDLADERVSHEVKGFAQIEFERERSLRKALDDYQTQYGKKTDSPAYQANIGTLNRQYATINGTAADRTAELRERGSAETAQIESEARVAMLSAEKQQTAAIVAEYDERVRQYREQLDQNLIQEEDFNRRVVAAAEQRDARLVESARQAREKMSGEFARFFQNPLNALKEMGDKAAGEAAAAVVQRLQNRAGVTASAESGTGGIFDRIAGVSRGGRDLERRNAGGGRNAAAAAMMSVAQARITIGSAMISGGFTAPGSPGALAAGAPAFYGATGSGVSGNFVNGSDGSMSLVGSGGYSSSGATGDLAPAGATGGGTVGTGISFAQKGVGLFSEAKGIFGRGASTTGDATGGFADTQSMTVPGSFGKDGTFKSGGTGGNGSMLGGGGVMANAAGAAGGAAGLYSAFQGGGGFGGALSGAMSGMQLGMSVGGPMGAAVGAAAGAVIGAIGFGGREKARVYDLKTVRPRITADTMGFQAGSTDYMSAYSDMQSLDVEARKTLSGMGPAAKSYYWDTVNKEIKQAEGRLTGEARAGRSKYTESAAQYAVGTDSVPRTGYAVIHENERITPSDQNERITRALEAGASAESIARGYRSMMEANSAPSSSGGDRTLQMNVSALDAKSVAQMLHTHKHDIRSALNSSYAENSGGADA